MRNIPAELRQQVMTGDELDARLDAIDARAAEAHGITPAQARYCREQNLDAAEYAAFAAIHNVDDFTAHRRATEATR